MVGLADIPCLGKFVERLSENTVDALFRGLRYMFCYKALVEQLNFETQKLNIEKDKMCRKIEEEKNNGKTIQDYVLKWQSDVEDIQKSGDEVSPSCSCIQRLPIPNPVSRLRIGRNAAKKAVDVAKLTGTGKDYLTGGIAHLPPAKNLPKPDTAFEEFESRKEVYMEIWDGLVNKDSPLVHGIYGMPGVGKTRMMENIWKEAMDKKIFDKVVPVYVGSEDLNEIDLQGQIADCLDCNLESRNVRSRASQLENSLRNGGKILFILDDLWREILLENIIGTPFGDGSSSNGSKILLTSRQMDVCLLNKCRHLVEIKTLNFDEALYLFINTVGTIDSLEDESLVRKVCDECGHLPLLIHAVGKALKGKPQNCWKDALDQLKKGKFEKIPGVPPKVYAGIKLSIDYLEHDDAKSCLFLCSMFPEDANIDMKMLIQLATGSQLIPDGESRILAMVHHLKISSLLLESGRDNETKVHDTIRDVARSMASKDSQYAFLDVKCNSRHFPSDDTGYCTRKFLRLDVETYDVHFREDLECPDLHTLWLQCNKNLQQFSGGFFRIFGNLSFLMLQNVNISFEKFSLQPLGKLRTLYLLKCDIRKTDVSLFPKKLETLCICDSELPSPMNVANLKYLRKLEIQVQEWGQKLVMGSNVISSLSGLEELHIPNGYIIDLEKYEIEPIVTDISELTRLKSLQFHFYDDGTFQRRNVFSDIDCYNIYVGDPKGYVFWERDEIVPSTKSIELHGNNWKSWEGLMVRAEEVRLAYSDVEVSSICNGQRRAFEDLKELYIKKCDKLGHLTTIPQNKIQYSLQHGATCFSKLTILYIEDCSELKYLFCNNSAKRLVQLQQLSVKRCESLEAIIMNEGISDGKIINFPRLKVLAISVLPRLESFYAEKNSMPPGSTLSVDNTAQHQPFFSGMVAFPSLEVLHINDCDKMGHLASISEDDSLQHGATCFSKLTILDISSCSAMKYLFCNNIAKSLLQLQWLNVLSCDSMKAIMMNEDTSDAEIIIFSKLKSLKIEYMRKLASFSARKNNMPSGSTGKPFFDGTVAFPLLEELVIDGCDNTGHLERISQDEIQNSFQPATCFSRLTILFISSCSKMKYLFCNNIAENLLQLQELSVYSCGSMEGIITNKGTSDGKIINFSKLKILMLSGMPKLASFYVDLHSTSTLSTGPPAGYQDFFDGMVAFPSLLELSISWLPYTSVIWGKDCYNDTLSSFCKLKKLEFRGCGKLENVIPQAMLPRLKNLEIIEVHECSSLRTMFPPSVATDLTQLNYLSVQDCTEMREIIETGEQMITDGILFPQLRVLRLYRLPSLTSFWSYHSGKDNTCKVPLTLPRLSSLFLDGLPQLRSLFHGANFEFYVPALEDVDVCNCKLLEDIFEHVRDDMSANIGYVSDSSDEL